MDKILCNPLNLEYRYQIKKGPLGTGVFREAADPTMLLFKNTYFLFASMSGGFWYSDDLHNWDFKETPELPFYDYAPDVREIGGAVVFSASKRGEKCTFYRSENPLKTPFKPVSASLEFWDPDVFCDDDGRVFFYWGCTTRQPLWGIELNPTSLEPIGTKVAILGENEAEHGWERGGENNKLARPKNMGERIIRFALGTKPCIEGAFMTKHNGKYYMQYATPGTELNVYSDGVYIGKGPLGPFEYQPHNPFSSKPGGFITAAGHGSTFQDKAGNWWHTSTMRVSATDNYERRVGLFPCDFDTDGLLHCNQNFADYPFALPDGVRADMDRTQPEWMLLSYGKSASASSFQQGYEPEKGMNEDIRTWWAAKTAYDDEWYQLDLGCQATVYMVQLNFADHKLPMPPLRKKEMRRENIGRRLIITETQRTRFLLEGSLDSESWVTLKDSRNTDTDYAHDLIVLEKPLMFRYLRVSNMQVPMGGVPAISGLRVFGTQEGKKPQAVNAVQVKQQGDLNIILSWAPSPGAIGYNVRYGIQPDKLYASWQVHKKTELDLSTVNKGSSYYAAVDAFNECGVAPGAVIKIR